MITHFSPQEIVTAVMKAATPERSNEIDQLWGEYHPKIELVKDRAGITLDATKERIKFDPKTIDVFWLIGFSAWRSIECYSPYVAVLSLSQRPLKSLIDFDTELPVIEREYKERLAAARALIEATSSESAPWPDDIPRPSENRDLLDDVQYKAAFDLTSLALAFTLFHEFRHVMLDTDHNRPKDRKEEELHCDVWSRQFMTEQIEEFAKTRKLDFVTALNVRSMGLTIAALILHEITTEHGGNCEYFSIKSRLTSLLGNTRLPETSRFWWFAASVLVGIYRQRHIALPVESLSPKQLAQALLEGLPE